MFTAIFCLAVLVGVLIAASKASKDLEDWYEPDPKTMLLFWSQTE